MHTIKKLLLLLGVVVAFSCSHSSKSMSQGPQKVTFTSLDALTITADLYLVNDSLPFILLCHQAGSSRGEYLESAVRLNGLGYNCLAIDLRSGEVSNKIKNETAVQAKRKGRGQDYLDAEQDMIAAVYYLYNKYKKKVIVLGSSYSASLALKLGAENNKVAAVIAFSPGDYFGEEMLLSRVVTGLKIPVFLASSRTEYEKVRKIYEWIPSAMKVQFVPGSEGDHGSKVLWQVSPAAPEYWSALENFLIKVGKI